VHAADIQDRDEAKLVLEQVKDVFPILELIWADAGYSGKLIDWVNSVCGWILEIVRLRDDVKEFSVSPKKMGSRMYF
jgi:putative transposase